MSNIKLKHPNKTDFSAEELASVIELSFPKATFPGENPEDLEKFQKEMFQVMVPKTKLQAILIIKIIWIEWVWQRYINMIDQSALYAYRRQAISSMQQNSTGAIVNPVEKNACMALANQLISSDLATRSAAETELAALGIERGELVCRAFENSMGISNICQMRILQDEDLRRRLKAELVELQSQ